MDRRLHLVTLLPVFFSFFLSSISAQSAQCLYQLILQDEGADGWEGAALRVAINGQLSSYTLEDGAERRIFIPLQNDDNLLVDYQPGMGDAEVQFTLLTPAGDTLFAESGLLPFQGESFSQTVACARCPEIPSLSVEVTDVRDVRAQISWLPPDLENGQHLLRLGLDGFDPDSTQFFDFMASGSEFRLTNLNENTAYDLFLATLCADGDTSAFVGPYSFNTLWSNNVGAVEIISPLSACDIQPDDSIKVRLQNFGGQPQTLIPYGYSVNGEEIAIDMPRDGVYTGVLGKDSTDIAAFDRIFNFTEPGEYLVDVYTLLESDSVPNNDTTQLLITSIPNINTLPYAEDFETWGGGWTVVQAGDTATWAHGYPDNRLLNAPFQGTGAWATSLSGRYGNNELTYLLSPCLDFSSISEDPRLSVYLKLDLETCCDGLSLEQSTDGGQTWEAVGQAGEAINWYNNDRGFWSGRTDWFLASQILRGLAGEGDVRLRFVLQTDFANTREGVLIDQFRIEEVSTIDLSATALTRVANEPCGSPTENLTIGLSNLGLTPLTAFDVAYQVNDGEVVTENVGALALVPNTQTTYTFTTPFDASEPGTYRIKAWIDLGDDQPANDTAFLSFQTAIPLPYAENFEQATIPENWTVDAGMLVTNEHNNQSFVLSANLFEQGAEFTAATPQLGPVRPGETLLFDYRFVDFQGDGNTATELGEGDRLEVFVSTNCGASQELLTTIDQNTHLPTTDLTEVSLDLSAYVDSFVQVIFVVTRGTGDYWFDLDNVRLPNCPDILTINFEQSNYINGGSRTTAVVTNGVGPYQYRWNTGDTAANFIPPADGFYAVTVTDQLGCTGSATTVITQVPTLTELTHISLAPNPTNGMTWLDMAFTHPVSGSYRLLHTTGQVVWQKRLQQIQAIREPIDLRKQPAGLYFLQVSVEGRTHTEKIRLSPR